MLPNVTREAGYFTLSRREARLISNLLFNASTADPGAHRVVNVIEARDLYSAIITYDAAVEFAQRQHNA